MGTKIPPRILNLDGISSHVLCLTSTPTTIVAGTFNGEISFWNKLSGDHINLLYSPSDVVGNKKLSEKQVLRPSINKILYHTISNLIFYNTDNGYIFTIDNHNYQSLTTNETAYRLGVNYEIYSMVFDKNEENLYLGTNKPQIIIIDLTNVKKWRPLGKDTPHTVVDTIPGFCKTPKFLAPTVYEDVVVTVGGAVCYFLNLKELKIECKIGDNEWSPTLAECDQPDICSKRFTVLLDDAIEIQTNGMMDTRDIIPYSDVHPFSTPFTLLPYGLKSAIIDSYMKHPKEVNEEEEKQKRLTKLPAQTRKFNQMLIKEEKKQLYQNNTVLNEEGQTVKQIPKPPSTKPHTNKNSRRMKIKYSFMYS